MPFTGAAEAFQELPRAGDAAAELLHARPRRPPLGHLAAVGRGAGQQDPVDGDTVVLHTQWQHEDDAVVHDTDSQFKQSPDGWKLVVPISLVDRAAAYLLRTAQ